MPCYFIANISIKDPELYQSYLDRVDDVFGKFGGKYLAVDSSPTVMEGTWNHSRAVLIEFENEQDFREWYDSDEYRKILEYRLLAAECDSILVQSG